MAETAGMSRARSQRIQELFEEARRLNAGQLNGWLHERCGEDLALADEVLSLLAGVTGSSAALGDSIDRAVAGTWADVEDAPPGRLIGRYRVVRMPTILDFAKVDTSGLVMQGDSLVGLIEGRDPDYWKSRVVASEEVTSRDRAKSWRNTGLRVSGSLFYGNWHFISSRSFWPRRGIVPESLRLKVFNQAEDPQEGNSLARFFPDAYLRYRFTSGLDELQAMGEEAQRKFRSTQETNYEFDPDTLEHLKALGYVE